MFGSRIPLASLTVFCRALRHQLEAGLTLAQAMKQQGKKGPLAVRPAAARLAQQLGRGEDLQTALEEERGSFPTIFLALAAVAEDTGKLPEILAELEEYFDLQLKLRRDFLRQITWPAIQFGLAVGTITLLILILGMIGGPSGIKVMGLSGPGGALFFLVSVAAVVGFILAGIACARHNLPSFDGLLLRLPIVGKCLEALALGRFSLGLYITLDGGVPAPDALRLSLRATGNSAFAAAVDRAVERVRDGDPLADAIAPTRLFPEEFLGILATAEEAGREPDALKKQAQNYYEEATLRMKILTQAAGWLVWLVVAGFIITFIFSIFSSIQSAAGI